MIIRLIFILLLCLLASACSTISFTPDQTWRYTDLRGLDPADAPTPSHDLIALYTRLQEDELQIRLDWLDHDWQPNYDLYLVLDTAVGGKRELPLHATSDILWDSLLYIPAHGSIRAADSQNRPLKDLSLYLIRDPVMDIVTISLNRRALPGAPEGNWPGFVYQFQVFITSPDDPYPADIAGPLRSDQPPPPRARVLLAFWNSYPAYTPALALRRWDGAHTGPAGGRHGLYNLLRTAQAAQTPIALLDLKTPAALSALDYLGGLEMVREMAASGLLILPDYLSDAPVPAGRLKNWAANKELDYNQSISDNFGIASSSMVFAAPDGWPDHSQYKLTFARAAAKDAPPLGVPLQPMAWKGKCVLPVPFYGADQEEQQISIEGPSVNIRRRLVETALASNSSILILGGDLPTSAWGSPEMARAAFRYLANHPWIQPLNSQDLTFDEALKCNESSPAAPIDTPSPYASAFNVNEVENFLAGLQDTPPNLISEQAWQAYLDLFAPLSPASPDLPALRSNYLSLAQPLLEASQWAEAPSHQLRCDTKKATDNPSWCFLANKELFLAFESASGMLTHAFIRLADRSGQPAIHQFITPPAQVIAGLSPANAWNLTGGLYADPAALPGAFYEPGVQYQPILSSGSLAFISSDAAVRKEFTLLDDGLLVEYSFSANFTNRILLIPLALDPWRRFSPGWVDLYPPPAQCTSGWGWQIEPGIFICLSAPSFTTTGFSDSPARIGQPEDPNIDYPAGRFLPFPFSLVEINSDQSNFQIRMFISQSR